MFFRAANAPLALVILVLISASVFPSFATLAPRYVTSVASCMYIVIRVYYVCYLTVVSHCFGVVFVDMKSNFCCISDQFVSLLYVYVAVCKQRYFICKV